MSSTGTSTFVDSSHENINIQPLFIWMPLFKILLETKSSVTIKFFYVFTKGMVVTKKIQQSTIGHTTKSIVTSFYCHFECSVSPMLGTQKSYLASISRKSVVVSTVPVIILIKIEQFHLRNMLLFLSVCSDRPKMTTPPIVSCHSGADYLYGSASTTYAQWRIQPRRLGGAHPSSCFFILLFSLFIASS